MAKPPRDLAIDWFRVIAQLRPLGWKPQRIAERIGRARQVVMYWKQGGEPSYCDGEALLDLWTQVTGLAREFIPRTPIPPWRK